MCRRQKTASSSADRYEAYSNLEVLSNIDQSGHSTIPKPQNTNRTVTGGDLEHCDVPPPAYSPLPEARPSHAVRHATAQSQQRLIDTPQLDKPIAVAVAESGTPPRTTSSIHRGTLASPQQSRLVTIHGHIAPPIHTSLPTTAIHCHILGNRKQAKAERKFEKKQLKAQAKFSKGCEKALYDYKKDMAKLNWKESKTLDKQERSGPRRTDRRLAKVEDKRLKIERDYAKEMEKVGKYEWRVDSDGKSLGKVQFLAIRERNC